MLKAIHRPAAFARYELREPRRLLRRVPRAGQRRARARSRRTSSVHTGCLMLARVDGKSPAEYLTESERLLRALARRRASCSSRPATLEAAWDALEEALSDELDAIAAVFAVGGARLARHADRRVRGPPRRRARAASATVPSGASTGTHEARELRDGGERYGGRGVRRAVAVGERRRSRRTSPGGTPPTRRRSTRPCGRSTARADLSRLGANAVLAVSLAGALAAAAARGRPAAGARLGCEPPLLPLPMVNVISGGAHARGAGVDVQDFLVVPVGAAQLRRGDRVGVAGAQRRPRSSPRAAGSAAVARRRRGRPRARAARRTAPGSSCCSPASSARASRRAPRRRSPSTSPRPSSPPAAATRSRRRIGRSTPASSSTSSRRGARLPDRLARGSARRGRLGRAGPRRRAGSATASSCSATTSSSRRWPASSAASTSGVANAVLVKPNQCGTLTGARDGPRARPGGRLRDRRLGPLGRHRGRLARRPRGRLARRSDQGRLDDPLGAHGEVEPPAARSRRSSARRRRSPDATPWRGEREPQQAGGTPCGSASRFEHAHGRAEPLGERGSECLVRSRRAGLRVVEREDRQPPVAKGPRPGESAARSAAVERRYRPSQRQNTSSWPRPSIGSRSATARPFCATSRRSGAASASPSTSFTTPVARAGVEVGDVEVVEVEAVVAGGRERLRLACHQRTPARLPRVDEALPGQPSTAPSVQDRGTPAA